MVETKQWSRRKQGSWRKQWWWGRQWRSRRMCYMPGIQERRSNHNSGTTMRTLNPQGVFCLRNSCYSKTPEYPLLLPSLSQLQRLKRRPRRSSNLRSRWSLGRTSSWSTTKMEWLQRSDTWCFSAKCSSSDFCSWSLDNHVSLTVGSHDGAMQNQLDESRVTAWLTVTQFRQRLDTTPRKPTAN